MALHPEVTVLPMPWSGARLQRRYTLVSMRMRPSSPSSEDILLLLSGLSLVNMQLVA